jgi:hypothetical protein
MQNWLLHQQMLRNPPTTRMRDVHMLHHTQSVLMIDENSALRGNMPQRNDEEGGKTPRLSFSPASSVWGQMGRPWTTIGRGETHTTEKITEADYVAFFHQFFGFTNNPALAPFANVQCPCQRYVMGGNGAWDHINSCPHHSANWTIAHEHVLRTLERICNDAGYATSRKRVLPSEGTRRADLEVRNIRVVGKTDLLLDVTLRHPFIGAGRSGHTQGQLRNPDYPDQSLESAAADKIRHYRDPYQRNRQVAFLPACMSTSGRIHGELLRLLFFLSNKQADDYFEVLGYQTHKEEFCHSAAVSSFTATGAPLGWHVLKLWRCVAPPPPRDAMLLSLAGERGAGEARGRGSPTCRPATGSRTAFVGLMVTHPAGGRIASSDPPSSDMIIV